MGGLRSSRWYWRFALFATAHMALIVAAMLLMPGVVDYVGSHYPGVYFEVPNFVDPGPLEGLDIQIFCKWCELALWIALMVPLAFYLRIRWYAVVLTALSYIPLEVVMIIAVYNFFGIDWLALILLTELTHPFIERFYVDQSARRRRAGWGTSGRGREPRRLSNPV